MLQNQLDVAWFEAEVYQRYLQSGVLQLELAGMLEDRGLSYHPGTSTKDEWETEALHTLELCWR